MYPNPSKVICAKCGSQWRGDVELTQMIRYNLIRDLVKEQLRLFFRYISFGDVRRMTVESIAHHR
eukprot:3412401-Amphidinium_carterae.1